MKLDEFNILPGVVIDVNDPKFIGRVKADAPGLFNSEVMNKEGLPWIYPSSISGYQRFSTLREGSKIWILTNKDYTEFWYIPMFELNQDTKDIISKEETDYQDAEILLSRNSGDMGVYIYYTPSEGIVIKNSENTVINLSKDNKILINSGKGSIKVEDGLVSIGNSEEKVYPLVRGDKLKELLDKLASAFVTLEGGCTGWCVSLAPGVQAVSSAIQSAASDLKLLTENTKAN